MSELTIATLSGGDQTLAGIQVDQLSRAFQGELLRPGEDGYDRARQVWNGMVDNRPALIARCSGTPDVVAVGPASVRREL